MALTREERILLHQKSKQPTFGTGKPEASQGSNGDISFRQVEGSGTVQYVKAQGNWVAIASSGEMPAIRNVSASSMGTSSGVTTHSSLNGLLSDDHTQYLLVDGTRAMTGDLSLGGGDGALQFTVAGENSIKILENKKDFDFFESQVLLTLDSILKEKYEESENYLEYLNELKSSSVYENAIYDTLTLYLSTFKNKKLIFQKSNFDNLDLLNITFLKCYLEDDTTSKSFYTLVNSSNVDYSRYLFFYSNYLINQNKAEEAKKLFLKQDKLTSGLLILQTNDWLKNNQTKKITDIFSCKSETDLLAEFFFLISNLYSSDEDFERSNFYLSVSNFLNEKFKANKLLTVENYFNSKKYKEAEKILKNFSKQDKLFYWFKVKIKTKIIAEKHDDQQALNYIKTKFNKIENKTDKIIFDMANIYKNYKNYKEAIELYSQLMKNYDSNSDTYADLLFRRGGSYERLSNFERSDKDLLTALKKN